jgi:hypothetical protein
MSKNRRRVVEVVAPPFVAAMIMVPGDRASEWYMLIAGFFPFMLFAYSFGIIPSVIYALAMELWFHARLHERCGLVCTIGVSGLLGLGAGLAAGWSAIWMGILTSPDDFNFAAIGTVVGLLLGFYVGEKYTIDA